MALLYPDFLPQQREYRQRGALVLVLSTLIFGATAQSFGPVSAYSAGPNSTLYAVALGDVTGDGRPDIVTTDFNAGSVLVLPGQAGGSFGAFSSYPGRANGGPQGVALGDLNGDGRLDIVVTNTFASNVGVLLGQAGGGFAAMSFYSTGTSTTGASSAPRGLVLRDVSGDGRLDIITANGAAESVAVLLGLAGGGFATAVSYSTGSSTDPYSLALGDVNGDGRADIVAANGNDTVGVLPGQAGGTFGPAVAYPVGSVSIVDKVALGDVNRDGRLDIVTTNFAAHAASVLLGQASGGFGAATNYQLGALNAVTDVALGDVNGDGRLDIVAANGSANTVGVLPALAAGGFGSFTPFATGASTNPLAVVLGDVNGDGRPDIVAANYNNGTVGVLLNTGTYTPLATVQAAGPGFSLAPNPAHDAFTVQLPPGTTAGPAELLNALGQVVRRPAAAGAGFTVETAGLPPGLYTLRLQVGAVFVARRVEVE
ncbi:MAG: T9SS type A sorting domain-containing protein [Bacteroidota bacterium]|nr:T9SS type A sorting domain-containing protein [Bacteroidota bacterium]